MLHGVLSKEANRSQEHSWMKGELTSERRTRQPRTRSSLLHNLATPPTTAAIAATTLSAPVSAARRTPVQPAANSTYLPIPYPCSLLLVGKTSPPLYLSRAPGATRQTRHWPLASLPCQCDVTMWSPSRLAATSRRDTVVTADTSAFPPTDQRHTSTLPYPCLGNPTFLRPVNRVMRSQSPERSFTWFNHVLGLSACGLSCVVDVLTRDDSWAVLFSDCIKMVSLCSDLYMCIMMLCFGLSGAGCNQFVTVWVWHMLLVVTILAVVWRTVSSDPPLTTASLMWA